jgi:hypothetical protein
MCEADVMKETLKANLSKLIDNNNTLLLVVVVLVVVNQFVPTGPG